MFFKKLTAALLSLTLCLSAFAFVGCSDSDQSGNTNAESTPTSEPSAEETFTLSSLSVNGVDISNYTIVYARSEFYKVKRFFTTEYDFWKLIATEVQEKIQALTGVSLTVSQDTETQETAYEILVGPTDRSQSEYLDSKDVYTYSIKEDSGKLIVGGGYNGTKYTGRTKESYVYASTYGAFDHLIEHFTALDSSDVNIESGFLLEGTSDIKTIACVGDSITEGFASSDMNIYSYPAVLQRILWKDSFVINCGNSGKTMRSDFADSYQATVQYSALTKYAANIDYVFVMLGTNDSDRDRSWSTADNNQFISDGLTIAEKVSSKNSDVQFFIFNCPVYYGSGTSGSKHVRELQEELCMTMADRGYKVSFFDMYTFTKEQLGSSLFPDALHPNDEGYAKMAQGVADMFEAFEAGTYTFTFPIKGTTTNTEKTVSVPELTQGSVNILGHDLSKLYPIESTNTYASWYMAGAPYIFVAKHFEGYTVTDIEVPVSYCQSGDYLTISVIKYGSTVTETLSTQKCSVNYDMEDAGWARITGLSIEVPGGYTLAFGKSTDTLSMLYLTGATANVPSGYVFYISSTGSQSGNDTLAFNVYGTK